MTDGIQIDSQGLVNVVVNGIVVSYFMTPDEMVSLAGDLVRAANQLEQAGVGSDDMRLIMPAEGSA